METPRVLIRPAEPYEPPARPPDAVGQLRPVATSAAAGTLGSTRPRPALSAATVDARRFAIGTVTLVLEILDRRRSVNQLDSMAPPQLLDQVATLVRVHGAGRAPGGGSSNGDTTATLRRVHVQMRGPGSAEIFGSYQRGERVRAFAARIEQLPRRVRNAPARHHSVLRRAVEYRWQLVTFTLV